MSLINKTLRFAVLSGAVLTLPALTGCLDHPLKPAELDTAQVVKDQIQLNVNKDVDILFVIDNSGSMGEEQAILAANFGEFIAVLENPEVKANYRLGVTTTDNGNVWCGTTSPEAGALVYSSCQDRIGTFTNQQGDTDVSQIACLDRCNYSSADLGIGPDSDPWLENIEGTTNIPDGVTTTEAFQCVGPQGIDGCGFESQLESMNKALIRFDTASESSFGFKRENAILAVVHVTDEADCSFVDQWKSIFETSGNKVFWHPDSPNTPTSAICWNAGTACTDNGNGGYDCVSADYDVDGNQIADAVQAEELAVLHPLARYIERVQGIENDKKEINPGQEVIVGLIGGVQTGAGATEPSYTDPSAQFPGFEASFGIGPGCAEAVAGSTPCTTNDDCMGVANSNGICGTTNFCMEDQTAIPPVRLAEFTDHFTENNKFSICNPDYSVALEAIANAIADQLKPACYTECVQDQDLTTPNQVDPECIVTETVGTAETQIPECLKQNGQYVIDMATNEYAMPDDQAVACYALLIDPDGSVTGGTTLDDMSQECVDGGFNLEFKLARKPGNPAQGGSTVSASCVLSELPQEDCPNL